MCANKQADPQFLGAFRRALRHAVAATEAAAAKVVSGEAQFPGDAGLHVQWSALIQAPTATHIQTPTATHPPTCNGALSFTLVAARHAALSLVESPRVVRRYGTLEAAMEPTAANSKGFADLAQNWLLGNKGANPSAQK